MPELADPPAREVHAVLAAAMADPELLDRWRREPASRAETGAGSTQLDIERVWQFSGLVTKVRHNDLRPSLPGTFKLLDSAGLSIEFFAAYAPRAAQLRKVGRNSKAAKLSALMAFLDGWLDRTNPDHALVGDVSRHESALFHLRTLAAAPPTGAVSTDPVRVSAETLPVRRVGAVQHEMSCNPAEAVRIIRSDGDPGLIRREPCVFAYCLAPDGVQIRVMAIDAIASLLLYAADGNHSVSGIAAFLQGSGIPVETEEIIGPIGDLVASGLLEIRHTGD